MKTIIDNRIVQGTTFATRLVDFLKDIKVNDAMSEEELEYLQRVADDLLKLQIKTATEKEEIVYLERVHKISLKRQMILQICKEVIKKRDPDILTNQLLEDTPFVDVCFDFYDLIELVMALERELNFSIDDKEVADRTFETVKEFIDFVEEQMNK